MEGPHSRWRLDAVPATAAEAAETAIIEELPSAAEQAAMDEVASKLVAKLNAAYEQMEPDDVDSGSYSLADADAIEVEPATAAGLTPRKGGRRHKPRPKEVPADALPKVCLGRHTLLWTSLSKSLAWSSQQIDAQPDCRQSHDGGVTAATLLLDLQWPHVTRHACRWQSLGDLMSESRPCSTG